MKEKALYDKYNEGKHWENHPTKYAEIFSDFLKENNVEGLVLDIGCGSGRDLKVFADAGFQTLGLDISEEIISEAKNNQSDLRFELGDVEKLNLEDNSVSAVFMINVIHYVAKDKAISEILRVLKPGGFLFIHFNLSIIDSEGNIDYSQDEENVRKLISSVEIVGERKFERIDFIPKEHEHQILELILKK